MYDGIVKEMALSADEVNLIKDLLVSALYRSISVGEEILIQELLEKLEIKDS